MLAFPPLALILSHLAASTLAKLTWANTETLFVFGDSYSTLGLNISVDAKTIPVSSYVTTSNGPNWVQYLTETYNVTNLKVYNGATPGSTIDAALVPPAMPVGQSIVTQVSHFKAFHTTKQQRANWDSSSSLFAIWIGLNDVRGSFDWSNVTSQSEWHNTLLNRLFSQVHELYEAGARSFLFLTIPPAYRAPLFISEGPSVASKLQQTMEDYNDQLVTRVQAFEKKHLALDFVKIFDSRPVINTLLDNAQTLGYANSTGFCEAYMNGTNHVNLLAAPCAPAFSYFWLNTLHPVFSVHSVIAQTIATALY